MILTAVMRAISAFTAYAPPRFRRAASFYIKIFTLVGETAPEMVRTVNMVLRNVRDQELMDIETSGYIEEAVQCGI
jgi:hypothetical protein